MNRGPAPSSQAETGGSAGGAIASNNANPIAYIMSRFPTVSETFIIREMLELEKQGQSLIIFPLLRARPPVRHVEVETLMSKVHYTPFISFNIILANIHYFRYAPFTYLKVLYTALRGTWGSANLFIGAIGIFPKSVYFARLVERQEIRHVHAHFATHPALAALIISELTGVGFSFTAHGHDVFIHNTMLDVKIKKARFAVTISQFNKEYILKLFPEVSSENIKVVRCGVELERYARQLPARRTDRLTIICVASLEAHKGISDLVKACAHLKGTGKVFRCLIVGDGEERIKIEALIRDLKLSDVVCLLGAQPQNKVADFLAEADLFVLPSHRDALPVALMEAMASGLPVVASRLSGIPELVEDGVNGFLTLPGDEHALADAIAAVFDQPHLRREFGDRGREKVAADFDLSRNVEKLRELFSDVLDHETEARELSQETIGKIAENVRRHFLDLKNEECLPFIDLQQRMGGGDSIVYQVTIKNARRHGPSLMLKLHRPNWASEVEKLERGKDFAQREYEALSFLWREFSRHSHELTVPRPLGLLPEVAGVLTEACEGQRLDRALRWARLGKTRSGRVLLRRWVKGCGEWLGLFHRITEKAGTPEEIYRRMERELRVELDMCRAHGLAPVLADRVAAAFEDSKRIAFNGDHKIVGRHCDFAPWNVFVTPERLAVIDFEGFQDGLIYDDLCYFLGHIATMPSYHLGPSLADGLAQSFLEGYTRHQKVDSERLDAYMLVTMVKIMARRPLLRDQAAGWRDRWKRSMALALHTAWFEEHVA